MNNIIEERYTEIAMMRLIFGSDHAGYQLKKYLTSEILTTGVEVQDMGCYTEEICDYPDIAKMVGVEVLKYKGSLGILVCGTGIGISIAANKMEDIRCALCHDIQTAKMARQHNNANIIALGGRILNKEKAKEILLAFIKEEFEGGRHQERLNKIKHMNNMFK
jgi:RpiB/LacA/LacB family sugar-phosphate isomerase